MSTPVPDSGLRQASPGSAAATAAVNADRARRAGHRDAAIAALALTILGDSYSPLHREIAEARAADPDASWRQIGEKLGLTKDAAHNRFRRMLALKPVRQRLGDSGA